MMTIEEKILGTFKAMNTQVIGGILAVAVAVTGGYYGLRYRAMVLAEGYNAKGFGMLATETLDAYRHSLVSSTRGCQVMLNSYYQTRNVDKLEWVSEACLNSGKDIPDVYIGLAATRELTGKDNEALQILAQVLQKFDKIPDVHLRIAQILQRNKKEKEALSEFMKASDRAPLDNRLAMDTLQYALAIQSWTEAKSLADRLKAVPTDNAEVKLVIARALSRGGDAAAAKTLADEAREMITKTPNLKSAYEQAYADILNPQAAKPEETHVSVNKHHK